jgi:hypothetical protein
MNHVVSTPGAIPSLQHSRGNSQSFEWQKTKQYATGNVPLIICGGCDD